MTATDQRFARIIDAAKSRTIGQLTAFEVAYRTDGGTWVLASDSRWNDDARPHDLIAVLPMALDGSRVLRLRPTVSPDLVDALRAALDDINDQLKELS